MNSQNDKITRMLLPLALAVYLLFGLASLLPLESMFGFNHINFLPFGSSVIFYAGLVAMLIFWIANPSAKLMERLETAVVKIATIKIYRLIIAFVFCLLFYGLRMKTHFLGDGYSWLSLLGSGETSFHKFAEPGSIYLVKFIQSFFGGFTKASALATFQILSVLSGGVVIYNLLAVVERLKQAGVNAILVLVSLLFSGHLLLYFGYVEFYPLSWATVLIFINLSLWYLQSDKGLLLVSLSYIIALGMHLQALYFLPALCYLVVIKFRSTTLRKIGYTLMGAGAVAGVVFLVWLYRTNLAFEVLILPLFNGRPPADSYTILSLRHFYDIFNLILLVFPGVIILLPLLFSKENKKYNQTMFWLILLSAGAISFLLVYGAAITSGFDWDIYSLTILPLMLLLLYKSRTINFIEQRKFIFTYAIVGLLTTGTFLYANINTSSSEMRYYSLLNSNHRSSWVMFADYYESTGNNQKREAILLEMNQRFPDYVTLTQIYQLIGQRNFDSAFVLADSLYHKNPYNADFYQVLGNLYGKKFQSDSAVYYYQRAITLKPYNTGIQNELGQLYTADGKFEEAKKVLSQARALTPKRTALTESMAVMYLQQNMLDSARYLADQLFADDPDSPGAHLIMLAAALHEGDELTALYHYNMFLIHGKNRSDYKSISEYYKYLNDRHLK